MEKKYRQLGYVGVRVTTDFSVQKSVDRNAKNVRLNIHVNERKRVTVVFEGNTSTSSSSLRDELTLLSRGSYDDFEVGASADAIQRYYQQRGRFFARVDWRRERLSAEEERIVFMIDEGPELRVRGIEFAGNSRLSSKELAGVVSVRKWPWMGLGAGGYVTGRQMEGDVERIVEHYRSKGFLEAKARAEAATSPAALGQIGRGGGRGRYGVARRARDLRALHHRRGPAAAGRRRRLPHRQRQPRCPTRSAFCTRA